MLCQHNPDANSGLKQLRIQLTDIGAPFLGGMSLIKLVFGVATPIDPFLKCSWPDQRDLQ
ncbi:hypothetical protein L195_g061965, partial [Trifolium pratense]